jgi:predicted lactoylglutathione lyase
MHFSHIIIYSVGNIMKQKISCITLGVADLEKSKKFYVCLGWQHIPHPASLGFPGCLFRLNTNMNMMLMERNMLANSCGKQPGNINQFKDVSYGYAADSKDEVCDIRNAVINAGGLVTEIKTLETGKYIYAMFDFFDPDSHSWEVVFAPDLFCLQV